jgi:hypothetical protein
MAAAIAAQRFSENCVSAPSAHEASFLTVAPIFCVETERTMTSRFDEWISNGATDFALFGYREKRLSGTSRNRGDWRNRQSIHCRKYRHLKTESISRRYYRHR